MSIWARPFKVFEDALNAFFEVERAEMEACNSTFATKPFNHSDSVLDPIVFDEFIIMLGI